MGPGAITPDKDIKTASNKKADSNNFHSLAGKIFLLYSIYSSIALILGNHVVIFSLFVPDMNACLPFCISFREQIDHTTKIQKENANTN
jgi:hypothetical protein